MVGVLADARPGALPVIEGEAVRLRTPVLELGRVVDLPELAQTGARLVVHSGAAVLRRSEGRTG